MGHRTRSIAFAAMILGAMATGAIAQTELLANGGFESNGTGWNLYRNTSAGVTAAATVAYDLASAHSGTKGAHVTVTDTSSQNWHIQLQFPIVTLAQNKVYRVSYWAKGPGAILLGVSDSAWGYLTGFSATLTSQWTYYSGTLVGDGTKRHLSFYVGLVLGDYTFDDVSIAEIGTLDPTWYASADARIEANRKQDFAIHVKDASGAALSGASVSVKLLQHGFPFGTALNFQDNADDAWYKQQAAKYFWGGVNEVAFKWPSYEPAQGTVDSVPVDRTLDWAESQDWRLMRGHALEWGIEKYGYDTHWPRLLTCAEYAVALKTRIDRDMAWFHGRFKQYDVWNEVFHEPAIFTRCGWGILDSAYRWARAADPTAKLFLNEYSVVEGGQTDQYLQIIQGFQQRGVPLDGIGVQGHFGTQAIDPSTIAMRLDQLAATGLPIMFTEFDMGDMTAGLTLTPAQQASEYAKFVRSAFSYPQVQGLVMWGFWDKRHWIKGAGIIDSNKVAKPAADSLWNLWNVTWTTNLSGSSDASGIYAFRGFKGRYEVTIGAFKDTVEFGSAGVSWDLKPSDGSAVATLAPRPPKAMSLTAGSNIRLFDLQGKLLFAGPLPQAVDHGRVNVPGLKPGLGILSGQTVRVNLE